jgi:uncharacterized membrane protein YhaH (DUF805 family)
MNWVYLLDSFEGRIGRKTFWIAMGAVTIAEIVGHVVAEGLEGSRLNAIVDLAFTYPEFAIAVKRGYDRNMPPWIVAAFFAGGVLLDFLTVTGLAGTAEEPSLAAVALAVPLTIFGFALLIELGLRRGTPGPNRYGPDPLGQT